ncbi:MAG: hypothetical protein PVF57_02065 [Pseudomonadales bacterium]|jgi:hypothetical protein
MTHPKMHESPVAASTAPESDAERVETLTALADSDDLQGFQDLAVKLLRDHGVDPADYHAHMEDEPDSEVSLGAHMLFYVDWVRRSLAGNDARSAVWAALRLAEKKQTFIIQRWERDARLQQAQPASGSKGGRKRSTDDRKTIYASIRRRFPPPHDRTEVLRKVQAELERRGTVLTLKALRNTLPKKAFP